MLAWGTCCRFVFCSESCADHKTCSTRHSSWIRHFVLLSRNINNCWRPGFNYLHTLFVFATSDLRLPWAHHSKEMSARFCSNRVDKTEIRHCDCLVFEYINVNSVHLTALSGTCLYHHTRLVTLFLYMVAELSALQQIINALTGLDGLPAVIVECTVTTAYTGKFA